MSTICRGRRGWTTGGLRTVFVRPALHFRITSNNATSFYNVEKWVHFPCCEFLRTESDEEFSVGRCIIRLYGRINCKTRETVWRSWTCASSNPTAVEIEKQGMLHFNENYVSCKPIDFHPEIRSTCVFWIKKIYFLFIWLCLMTFYFFAFAFYAQQIRIKQVVRIIKNKRQLLF